MVAVQRKDHRRVSTRNEAKCQRWNNDRRVEHQKPYRLSGSSRQGHSTVAHVHALAELNNVVAVESRGNMGFFFDDHLQLL